MRSAGNARQVLRLHLCPCGTPVCPACQLETHDPLTHTCSARRQATPPDPATMAVMHSLGKPCPKCANFIEKAEGCDTMMCGCEAHGRVADALRAGGCGFIFSWNTMTGLDDPHGYHDMNGDRKTGEGPKTARQMDSPPTCARPDCPFLFHADPSNNGGTHCCRACQLGKKDLHDGHCHQLLASEELANKAANAAVQQNVDA
jgi:hypothetical protein